MQFLGSCSCLQLIALLFSIDNRLGPDGQAEYFVKWKGYGEADNTWEPIENFETEKMKAMIVQYEKNSSKRARPKEEETNTDYIPPPTKKAKPNEEFPNSKTAFITALHTKLWSEKYNQPIPPGIVLQCLPSECKWCSVKLDPLISSHTHYNGPFHKKRMVNEVFELHKISVETIVATIKALNEKEPNTSAHSRKAICDHINVYYNVHLREDETKLKNVLKKGLQSGILLNPLNLSLNFAILGPFKLAQEPELNYRR